MNLNGHKILLIGGNRQIQTELPPLLLERGGQTVSLCNIVEIRGIIESSNISLIVIGQLSQPGEELELIKWINHRTGLPVILICNKACSLERVVALEVGADDVVQETCESRELVARIISVLRRAKRATTTSPTRRTYNQYRLVPQNKIVMGANGQVVQLSKREYSLLHELVSNAGQAVSRELLSLKVLSKGWNPLERNIDNLVAKVRRQLGRNALESEVIVTIRNKGYLVPEGIFIAQ